MIATVETLKDHLAFTDDIGEVDDLLLAQKLAAAEGHICRLLGFDISATYGGEGQEPVPAPLIEAVLQLASHWYENREGVSDSMAEVPFGVSEIVTEYRGFTF